MVAYADFEYGGVAFPLADPDDATGLLAVADPAIKKILDFGSSVLNTYLATSLTKAASSATLTGSPLITTTVKQTIGIDPGLVAKIEQLGLPLLAVWRTSEKWDYRTTNWRQVTSQLGCCYILPPLSSGQAQRIHPVLNAVGKILDAKFAMGFDPAYNSGETVWTATGISRVRVLSANYGSSPLDAKTQGGPYFHAWMGTLEMVERVANSTAGFNDLTENDATITDGSIDPDDPVDMVDLELDAT